MSPSEPRPGSQSNILTKNNGFMTGKPLWWRAFDGGHTPIPVDGGEDKEKSYTGTATWEFFSQFQGLNCRESIVGRI